MFRGIQKLQKLAHLDISNNKLDQQSTKALLTALSMTPRLSSFSGSRCMFNTETCVNISSSLTKNSLALNSVVKLDLSSSEMEDRILVALSDVETAICFFLLNSSDAL